MTKATERQPHSLALDGGSLGTLQFTWRGDRYSHAWSGGKAVDLKEPVLESIESDSSALWPISPPLQQIHQQQFDDGRQVIFGVGMSGRGHWSASFTLIPELNCWIVELACRSPLIPELLSCAYRLRGDWVNANGEAWLLHCGLNTIRLEPISPSSRGSESIPGELHISPLNLPSSHPSTTQWAYRLKWINSPQ